MGYLKQGCLLALIAFNANAVTTNCEFFSQAVGAYRMLSWSGCINFNVLNGSLLSLGIERGYYNARDKIDSIENLKDLIQSFGIGNGISFDTNNTVDSVNMKYRNDGLFFCLGFGHTEINFSRNIISVISYDAWIFYEKSSIYSDVLDNFNCKINISVPFCKGAGLRWQVYACKWCSFYINGGITFFQNAEVFTSYCFKVKSPNDNAYTIGSTEHQYYVVGLKRIGKYANVGMQLHLICFTVGFNIGFSTSAIHSIINPLNSRSMIKYYVGFSVFSEDI